MGVRSDGKSFLEFIDLCIGELFYRNQPIPVILEMNYSDLKYWHNWHMAIEKQWKKSIDEVNNKNA